MQYPLFRHKARGIASSARIKGDEAGGTTFKTYRENGASCAAPAVLPLYGMFFFTTPENGDSIIGRGAFSIVFKEIYKL